MRRRKGLLVLRKIPPLYILLSLYYYFSLLSTRECVLLLDPKPFYPLGGRLLAARYSKMVLRSLRLTCSLKSSRCCLIEPSRADADASYIHLRILFFYKYVQLFKTNLFNTFTYLKSSIQMDNLGGEHFLPIVIVHHNIFSHSSQTSKFIKRTPCTRSR
jgi:hypothetical protein